MAKQKDFVLTSEEATVLRSASSSYQSPFFDVAVSTRMVPSQVKKVFQQLEIKKLAENKCDGILLTSDGILAKNYLRASNSPYIHIINYDDMQKGRWGGLSEVNGRKLSAQVKVKDEDWYDLTLTVASINPAQPLTGEVVFHLHDSFHNPDRTVIVKDNKAELNLLVWGAFTVGAEADNGATRLELDLSELPGTPDDFRTI